MASPVRFCQPRGSDAATIVDLIESLGYRPPTVGRVRALLERVEDADGEVWLAAPAATRAPVGLVTVLLFPALREGGMAARIEELVVAPEWRGRGIGTLLLEHAEARARARGALWIELHTHRGRENYARGFYASRGYEELNSAFFRRWLADRDTAFTGR